jgi:hypothetical protein
MTVKGFFSPQELEQIIANINNRQDVVETKTPFGYVVGKKLSREDGNFQKLPLEEYFKFTAQFIPQLHQLLGEDFTERMNRTLGPVTGNRRVVVPQNPDNGASFLGSTVRICQPGGGGIHVHVGNEFNNKMADMQVLGKFARLHNQLSYFVLIQKPEGGGELDLFDLLWDDVKEQMSIDQTVVYNQIKNYKPYPVPLEAGDLIIFSGGRIWHQVNQVAGTKDRITLGGFMAFSEPMDKIYYWS